MKFVIIALLGSANAVKFRPLAGTAPWHKEEMSVPTFLVPDFPHNYTVVDHGEDPDMRRTMIALKEAENDTNHTFSVDTHSFWKPIAAPDDLRRPDYGVDRDILVSHANLEESESEVGHKLQATFQRPASPQTYVVPDFGKDADMKATEVSTKQAETDLNHSLSATFHPAPEIPKTDYKVANFGEDKDITATKKSLATAEKQLGKEWNLVQLNSDPICSSAGCTQYKQKTQPLGYDLDYFVPNFGPDQDVIDTSRSIVNAQLTHHHKLVMGTPESRAKYKNIAAAAPKYDYKPALDEDIVDSTNNLKASEAKLGAWTIEKEPAYNPYWYFDGK